jgi:hypothetical protein
LGKDPGKIKLIRGFEDHRNKKLACNGQEPSGMEENCIGSQSPQRTVVLEKKKKNITIYLVEIILIQVNPVGVRKSPSKFEIL